MMRRFYLTRKILEVTTAASTQDRPRFKMDISLNTLIHLITLAGFVAGGGYVWAETRSDLQDLLRWRLTAETRQSADEGKIEERFRSTDAELRKLDNLAYRVSLAEQSAGVTATALRDLQKTVAEQAGDLKVMREILQRLDKVHVTDRP
ncbi:hypothetical protein NAC44_15780 [Allorhizobium sp. BGMRC 0089]|uniref:hypothetical protein n=1 Tax=Allorhizobium sonneratiae TaxID=2934936 RepID=UPI002034990A|nr:hypothetical protein [Allorhizobium sonneratiae]MCM2293787.1 hypothetical protein [Allorhizobium sonneratiae]